MSVEIPDEYGLSSDSLRGSHQFVRPDLVGASGSRDPMTGRENPRDTLSKNEIRVLEDAGMLVDANGYERDPEPVPVAVPLSPARPRPRETLIDPVVETPNGLPSATIPPFGGTESVG